MSKTVQIRAYGRGFFGSRGMWNGFTMPQGKSGSFKPLVGVMECSDEPIRTRTKADGNNHRCECKSGKKARNCCMGSTC